MVVGLFRNKNRQGYALKTSYALSEAMPDFSQVPLVSRLDDNVRLLQSVLARSADVVMTPFILYDKRAAKLIYIEGLSSSSEIDANLLQPLIKGSNGKFDEREKNVSIERLAKEYITISEWKLIHTIGELVEDLMEQHVILLIDGQTRGLALSLVSRRDRSIGIPDTEALIRGPRESFNENIATSISLIRRRLPTPHLKVESKRLGEYTRTDVCVLYIEGIVDMNLVAEMNERLNRIKIDGILDSAYIEELIEDEPYSPFPQIQNTERPDVAVSGLLEGKVVILSDGSPFALVAPTSFWTAIHAAEDHYERYFIVNFIRILRYLFLFFALFLPAMYVAITTFHQEMLPTRLLLTFAAAREVTPLPAIMEAIVMEITFEILREAGVRLPKAIGSAVSIVGALVIGQAAVQAGMASAPMVIVVALTGIASFSIPRYNFATAIRILRFPIIILAGTFGMFGIIAALLAITIHLASLRSFGKPYMEPISPLSMQGVKDTLIRMPRWGMKYRPLSESKVNPVRQSGATRPSNRIPKRGGGS